MNTQDQIYTDIVNAMCKCYNVVCKYDHERHDSKPHDSAIPLVFYIKTLEGTVYVRKYITVEIINDPKAIRRYYMERILPEIDILIEAKEIEKDPKRIRHHKITDAYYKAYSKPLPLWRLLFCSFKSNQKWYDKRVKRFLNIS